MSRSRKKYPILSYRENRQNNRLCNRAFRRISKQRIGQNEEPPVSRIETKPGGRVSCYKTPFFFAAMFDLVRQYIRKK